MKKLLTMALLISGVTSAWGSDNIQIKMLPVTSAQEKQAMEDIVNSGVNPLLKDLSGRLFPFSQTLTIRYGGEEGPLYDPAQHQILVPYRFFLESEQYFKANGYDKKYGRTPEEGATDTLLHTLLHEAGHAYIADKQIPVLGKEEDAVDNFATLILLGYVEAGDDIAISAADMFAFESDDHPEYYEMGEFSDEHSFDLQRYFSTLCLVYGRDPEKHKQLLDELEKEYLDERKAFCIENYEAIKDNWHHYLAEENHTGER